MKKIFEKIKAMLKDGEAVRYIIIGLATTLVNFAVFTLMTKVLSLNVTASNITSVIISILFAYIANKIYVFKSYCKSLGALISEILKFVGARGITMVIEVGGVYLMYNIMDIDELIAKLITQGIVIIGNYFISKLIVFRKGK